MGMSLSFYQGKSIVETYIFTANTVWTPPTSGRALFIAVGPGGGGAGNTANASSPSGGLWPGAAGGGGGGACIMEVTLNTAATYTINVGTGGVGGSNASGVYVTAANGSGNTTVVSNDGVMNLQAGFGQAGLWSGNVKAAAGVNAGNAVGGAGGTSANGDYNFVGGTAANANSVIQTVLPAYINQISVTPMRGTLYVTGGAGAAYFSNGANSTMNSYSGASSVSSPIANDSTILVLPMPQLTPGGTGVSNQTNQMLITSGAMMTPGAPGFGEECGPGGYSAQFDPTQWQNYIHDIANNTALCAGTGGPFAGGGAAFHKTQGAAGWSVMLCMAGNAGYGGGGGGAMQYAATGQFPSSSAVVGGTGGNGIVIVKVVRG